MSVTNVGDRSLIANVSVLELTKTLQVEVSNPGLAEIFPVYDEKIVER